MSIKILLIEDNPDHIQITKKVLEKANQNYHLDSVNSPKEGLKRTLKQRYDLVLCDYRFPGLNALDILKRVRRRGKDLPFIIVTASGNEKAAVELMKEGAYDYIIKDISYEETLPVVIKRSLERYHGRKEKEILEKEVERQNVFLQNIINSLNYPFYVIDLDYNIILANKAARQRGIVEGKYCYELTHKQHRPCKENICPLKEVLRKREAVQVEHVHYEKNGSKRYVLVYADPIFEDKGEIVQMIEYVIDITDRKKAQEALQHAYSQLKDTQEQLIQSNKIAAIGQLAAGISHELNQPLTGIKGFAQAALMELKDNNSLRDDLQRIIEQADRMDRIIKNVRLLARKSEFEQEELDITQPIQDALMLLKEQLKLHNIQVKTFLAKNLPPIRGDPTQLQQVFLNFITNARDAIDSVEKLEGGELIIKTSLSKDKKNIEIVFQDTGCGISKENLNNIFNPFFTTKSPKGGIGLGLSIAYRIIESQRGKIEVESIEGKGTTFKIILPVI
jgi:PAS domain S-box-containing protein